MSLIAGTVLLSGCDSALLDPKGQIGLEQRSLILTAFGLMMIVVIPAVLMAVGFAWKYRASNKDAKYSPNWSHSNKVEAVVWTVPILIILFLAVLTALGIAVARKVDDVPVLINQEMIDEHGLSRSCGRHGESFTPRQHVDEAGFSNVGTSDEGVFGECPAGAFFNVCIADDEFGACYLHFITCFFVVSSCKGSTYFKNLRP